MMLELRDVSFTHAGAHRPVLSHVDLTLDEGELLLVAGPTGSGKSTLLGIVAGIVPRFSGGVLSGDVLLDGRSIVTAPPRERAAAIGYVGQDPPAGFVTDTVEEELAYGMEQLGLPADTMRRRVEETLDLLGIADLRDRDLRTLSGGQQQRVAIGSVLTMHPRLLVLDEPTSALDPTAAEDVLATVTRLVHDLGVSVMLAEHRLERVVPFADRMALLDRPAPAPAPGSTALGGTGAGSTPPGSTATADSAPGSTPPGGTAVGGTAVGSTAAADPAPDSPAPGSTPADSTRLGGPAPGGIPAGRGSATARLVVGDPAKVLADSPVAPPLVELGRALGWSPLPLTVRDARRLVTNVADSSRTSPTRHERRRAGDIRDESASHVTSGLAARELTVVRGAAVALREVGLSLRGRGVTALMGRNGAGKSTLLWALQGSLGRKAGRVDVAGRDPARLSPEERRGVVGLLPQNASDLLYLETVDDECAAGGPRTREILDGLVPGIPGDRHPRDLSEGQRLALALALVLAAEPSVLLLDEPTRGLDYAAKRSLADALRALVEDDRTVLVATHDVEFAALVADDVIVLAEGEVVSSGGARDVLAESPAFAPQVTKVFGPGWLTVEDVLEAKDTA